MLRFIKQNLESIIGVEIFPIISLLIFTTFFLVVIIRIVKLSKSYVSEVEQYPLSDDNEDIFEIKN